MNDLNFRLKELVKLPIEEVDNLVKAREDGDIQIEDFDPELWRETWLNHQTGWMQADLRSVAKDGFRGFNDRDPIEIFRDLYLWGLGPALESYPDERVYEAAQTAAMIAEDEAYAERDRLNFIRVSAAVKAAGMDPAVVYSVPADLDTVAISGWAMLRSDSLDECYKSPPVENPTWLDLCVLANRAILVTGDLHHIFLEGVRRQGAMENGLPVYEFQFGS